MAELDLIPVDYLQRQVLRHRLRRFVAAIAVIACLTGLVKLVLHVGIAAEKAQVATLQSEARRWAQGKAKVEEYRKSKLAAEKHLAALDELRGRDRLRLLLQALDAAYVENVWLDEIRYYRRDPPSTAALDVPGAPRTGIVVVQQNSVPGRNARDIEQWVGITGHAINHAMLAQFMRKLERQPGIADVSLLNTAPRAYPNALIIELKLSLLVDEKVKGRP
jgi:hypothetical protein